jgi:hypothetical protein
MRARSPSGSLPRWCDAERRSRYRDGQKWKSCQARIQRRGPLDTRLPFFSQMRTRHLIERAIEKELRSAPATRSTRNPSRSLATPRTAPCLPPGCLIIQVSDPALSLRQRLPGIRLLASKGFTYALDGSTAADRLSLVGKGRGPTASHTSGGIQGTLLRECDLPPLFPNEMCASLRQAGQER